MLKGNDKVVIDRSVLTKEIEKCRLIYNENPEDEYNKGRYNTLTAILWAADVKEV